MRRMLTKCLLSSVNATNCSFTNQYLNQMYFSGRLTLQARDENAPEQNRVTRKRKSQVSSNHPFCFFSQLVLLNV